MKYLKFILPIFLASPSFASFCGGYSNQATVTVSSANVAGNLTNFPVLISSNNVALSTTTGSGGQLLTGYDLIFTADSACATPLNFDTETIMNVGVSTLNVWVQVPSLSTASTTAATFYMTWGNNAISTYQGHSTGTWDSNFVGVYHLGLNGVLLSTGDSTSNGNTGTISFPPFPNATTGKIDGGAGTFIPSSLTAIDLGSSSSLQPLTFTLSAWVNLNASGAGTTRAAFGSQGSSSGNPEFRIGSSNDLELVAQGVASIGNDSSNISTGTWHYISVSYNHANNAYAFYLDGSQTNSGTSGSSFSTYTANPTLGKGFSGSDYYYGSMDEARFSNTVRSPYWLQTEYNSESSPATFVSYSQSSGSPSLPSSTGILIN